MKEIRENVIEWITGSDIMTVTISQKKYMNKVLKLKKKHPEDIVIATDNDGECIVAHLPLKYLHLFWAEHDMAEEDRLKAAERMKKYQSDKTKQ